VGPESALKSWVGVWAPLKTKLHAIKGRTMAEQQEWCRSVSWTRGPCKTTDTAFCRDLHGPFNSGGVHDVRSGQR
jgi:hypothetical protein